MVDKKLPANICRTYTHPTSRICTAVVNIMGTNLYLVNLYAPSGKNKEQERENLIQTELIYQLVADTDNIIMCGELCVITAAPLPIILSRNIQYME